VGESSRSSIIFIPLTDRPSVRLRPPTSAISESDWDVLADFWYPVAVASDLTDKPLAAKLLDVDLVLFRGTDGAVGVAVDVCPHRHIRLSTGTVIDGQVVCPFHGMRFDVTGRCRLIPALGAVAKLPASYQVRAFPGRERYGLIWTCLGDAAKQDIPHFPALDGVPTTELDFIGPQSWPVSAGRQIENFFDLAHLPLVHATTIGGDAASPIGPGRVETKSDGIWLRAHYVETSATAPPRPCDFIYRIVPPFAIDFEIEDETDNSMHAINIPSPTSAHACRVFQIFRATDGAAGPNQTLQLGFKGAFTAVNQQDIDVLSGLALQDMPLDQHHEVHLPVDNICNAYRAKLRELGLGRSGNNA
jgi:phenylpropionate dioxygenase-like ring-hydroxylating dioxygenase large terminal subunit